MRIGIVVIARATSSRLPRKHFQPIGDRPAIEVLLHRISRTLRDEIGSGDAVLYIATGHEAENNAFLAFQGVANVFFGDNTNIPKRLLDLVDSEMIDAVVSVDGDDLMCSPTAMRLVYELLIQGARRVTTKGLPFGMNANGYSADLLIRSRPAIDQDILETGWGRVFDEEPPVVIAFPEHYRPELRMTLDYPEDLKFFQSLVYLIPAWERMSDLALASAIVEKGINRINAHLQEGYWSNFMTALAEEKGSDE